MKLSREELKELIRENRETSAKLSRLGWDNGAKRAQQRADDALAELMGEEGSR
jgi:hypothetical protein